MARCQRAKVCRRPLRKNHVTRPVERISRRHNHHRHPSIVLDSHRPAMPRKNWKPVLDRVNQLRRARNDTRTENHPVASVSQSRRRHHQSRPSRGDIVEPQRSLRSDKSDWPYSSTKSPVGADSGCATRKAEYSGDVPDVTVSNRVITVGRVTEGFYDTALNEANDA